MVQAGDGVAGGGGQRQQRAFRAQPRIDPCHPVGPRHQPRRSGAEQAACAFIAARARHEHGVAGPEAGARRGLDHLAHRLVARNQRIAHAGKGGHAAGPEQFLGAGGDCRDPGLDHQVAGFRADKRQILEAELAGAVQKDSGGMQGRVSRGSAAPVCRMSGLALM